MASLTPTTGSASALLKTATSLATAQADYQDSLKAFEYANSAYTDESFATYKDYLSSRITSLNATSTLSGATKALSLTKALDSAGKSNISASITRENIQIMSGNATPTDKLNLIQDQFVRAMDNGDMTLAQSLESQAYSLSQSIQLQRQQSADAAATLGKANASAAKTDAVNKQADIVTDLNKGLEVLNTLAQDKSQVEFTKAAQGFVTANKETYSTLGVTFAKGGTPDTSPSYFDIVQGVMAAKYNAMVLHAQAENAIDPEKARQWASDADLFGKTGTQVTLAGRLTFQQVQEAAQSPNMYVYDNASGKYVQSTKTGYQYQTFTKYDVVNGKVTPVNYKAVVPTFSGFAPGNPQAAKTFLLTPNQTVLMNKLGLQIEAKVNSNGTVGTGIKAQAMGNTPDWLTKIIGKGAEDQFFNQNGQLQFSSGGKFYSLSQDGRGLIGLTEHNPDGSAKIVGGNYGFNPNPASKGGNGLIGTSDSVGSLSPARGRYLASDHAGVNKLIAQSQQQIAAIEAATAAANRKAALAMLALPAPPLPNISQPGVAAPAPIAPASAPALPKITWATPSPSVAQAPKVASPAVAPAAPGGINLQGGGGIRLQ